MTAMPGMSAAPIASPDAQAANGERCSFTKPTHQNQQSKSEMTKLTSQCNSNVFTTFSVVMENIVTSQHVIE